MSTLQELQNQLLQLVDWRNAAMADLLRQIQNINRHFDREAIQLNRQIRLLTPVSPEPEDEKPTPITKNQGRKRGRPPAPVLTTDDGYTQEEVNYFNQLLTTGKKR